MDEKEPLINDENTAADSPAPKRRGRPPKNATKESEPTKIPAKRGRKPKSLATGKGISDGGEKQEPLFSFSPLNDDISRREKELAERRKESTETAEKLDPSKIIAENRPQLSPERPPEKMVESVYSPDVEEPSEKPQENENNSDGDAISEGEALSNTNEQKSDAPATATSADNSGQQQERRDRFQGRGDRWERRNPQRFNPQDRNSGKGFSRFQPKQQQDNAQNAGTPSSNQQQRFQQKRDKFQGGKFNAQGKFDKFQDRDKAQKPAWGALANTDSAEEATLDIGNSYDYNKLKDESQLGELNALAEHTVRIVKTVPAVSDSSEQPAAADNAPTTVPAATETKEPCTPGESIDFNEIYDLPMNALIARAKEFGIPVFNNPQRRPLVRKILCAAFEQNRPIELAGTLELLANGHGLLLYTSDNFRVRELSAFVPSILIKKYGLQRGHELSAIVHPPMPGETAPIVTKIKSIMGTAPEEIKNLTPFTELTPYYPTERIMLETSPDATNNLSMRCVDLLCPIGLGQRGLIVAPPRVGKTVLLQTMANSILTNKPNAKLIVLLVDERPEEVTDFRRNTKGAEVISSTFDETAENHVHVAEMVIERARRMVELGMDVIILLDSITRLARAYNTLMPNGGKILSGGVEAGALAKPKRFFGSARNIEDGGSLTILGTALIDTGSKMDEVIFEEFKGTGNMELDLDRDLANKRIFPAINFERSGTRKEELLYHPDEMQYVYSMRRAMKGVPSIEAMEMLINRMKKTKTNIEFLMTLAGR